MPVRLSLATLMWGGTCGAVSAVRSEPAGSLIPRMVSIPSGSFTMGYSRTPIPASLLSGPGKDSEPAKAIFPNGDADESPAHAVSVSSFSIGVTEVTNAEYEEYDPAHRALRGRAGFSTADDEAVVFVSYENASRYASWLAKKTGKPYRLPSEAEWEYAARGSDPATNSSYFWTGDSLPTAMMKEQNIGTTKASSGGLPSGSGVLLTVARYPANSFGLHDTLGNVEEWCADWHGPYAPSVLQDPTGPSDGTFRVTRGGSHTTEPYYLRTANRHGALPTERSWFIGFRVAMGEAAESSTESLHRLPQPKTTTTSDTTPPVLAPGYVRPQKNASWPNWSDVPMAPVMRRYVMWPGDGSALPFSGHNHEPTIAACPNGDFVANWYSTNCGEEGRCVGLVQSRLRKGANTWTTAKVQLDAPDRNQCCTAFYFDRDSGVLYHFSAMSAAGSFQDIMGTLQWSTDCGETFSKPKIIWPDHGIEHQIVVTIIKSQRGEIMVPCDHWGMELPFGPMLGDQSIIQHAPIGRISDPAAWRVNASFGPPATSTQSHHTSFVELRNGSFAAIGRAHDIDGTMPYALSTDGGHVWTAKKSSFTGIHGGEREVMIRLGSIDQPLMHCTFANGPPAYAATTIPAANGDRFTMTVRPTFVRNDLQSVPVVPAGRRLVLNACMMLFEHRECIALCPLTMAIPGKRVVRSLPTQRCTGATKVDLMGIILCASMTSLHAELCTSGVDKSLDSRPSNARFALGSQFGECVCHQWLFHAWCSSQTMSYNTTEPNGYMAAAVSDDGIITLITSRNSYSFNLAWLKAKAPIPQ